MKLEIFLAILLCSTLVSSAYIMRQFDCIDDRGCVRGCEGGDPDCSCIFEGGNLCNREEYCQGKIIASWESEACCNGICTYADSEQEIEVLNLKEEIEGYNKYIENQKVVDLINYSSYAPISIIVSKGNDFFAYILLIFVSLVIILCLIYLIFHEEGESFIEFWKRIL